MHRSKPVHWFLPTLFGLTAVSALAQIQELATTRDGSQLVFSTPFRQKGTEQFSSFKIFQYSSGSYSLIAQTAPFVSLPSGTQEQDDFHLPNMSGDGRIVTWDESAQCQAGSAPCPTSVFKTGTIRAFVTGVQLPDALLAGSVRVSPNGRYYLAFCCWNSGNATPLQLYDSVTGTLQIIADYKAVDEAVQNIADDGSLILYSPTTGNYVYWKDGIGHELPAKGNRETPRMSGDGSTLVYQALDPQTERVKLLARDLRTGVETLVFLGPGGVFGGGIGPPLYVGPYFRPSISQDGRRVLFRLALSSNMPQAFVMNTDGSDLRQLTTEDASISELILSGDGRVGYATTQNGALLRIDIDSGEIQRLSPDMPQLFTVFPNYTAVPGSRIYVRGQGLIAPEGGSLVSLAGVAAPVISSATNLVMLQVPWEYDPRNPLTLILTGPQSPFEFATPLQSAPAFPAILDVWSADYANELSTSGKPAVAGDVVVLDLIGLGPVSPSPATGQPAPLDRLTSVQSPLSCSFFAGTVGLGQAEILFAGLTPTLVGAYQINLRTPTSIPSDLQNVGIACSVETSAGVVTSQPQYFSLKR
jgi:uncharacterized protein (TIGR03437 family)